MGSLSSELGPHVARLVERAPHLRRREHPERRRRLHADDARVGRALRARARRAAPRPGPAPLPARAPARPHARDARPRLHRRSPVPRSREPGRDRLQRARRALAAPAAQAGRRAGLSRGRRQARRSRAARSPGRSTPPACRDLPRRRRHRAARSPADRRHDRHRRRSHHRRRRRRAGIVERPTSAFDSAASTRSCPASSTCTCTASKGPTRWTAATPIARIAARLPRYGVTAFCPTIGRVRARRRCATMLAGVRAARLSPRGGRGAGAAGASREQLHQSRVSRRAAARVPARRRAADSRTGRRGDSPAPRSCARSRRRGPMWGS